MLAGVTVLVTFPGKTEGLRTGTTDGNGKVLFANLPGGAGRYEVHALKQGYDKTTQAFELLFEGGEDGRGTSDVRGVGVERARKA